MIDTHSHILPGMDDGSRSIEESVKFAKAAAETGISTIIATPHKIKGSYDLNQKELNSKLDILNKELQKNKIAVEVMFGTENYTEFEIDPSFSLNHTKYVLLEFPMNSYPSFCDRIIDDLLEKGYIPVVAHPEKCMGIIRDVMIIERLVNKGCLMQLNIDSLYRYPKTIYDFANFLLRNKVYHLIASNAHNPEDYEKLVPILKNLSRRYGEDIIDETMVRIPAKIINNEKFVPQKLELKERFHTRFRLRAIAKRLLRYLF